MQSEETDPRAQAFAVCEARKKQVVCWYSQYVGIVKYVLAQAFVVKS